MLFVNIALAQLWRDSVSDVALLIGIGADEGEVVLFDHWDDVAGDSTFLAFFKGKYDIAHIIAIDGVCTGFARIVTKVAVSFYVSTVVYVIAVANGKLQRREPVDIMCFRSNFIGALHANEVPGFIEKLVPVDGLCAAWRERGLLRHSCKRERQQACK